MPPRRKPTSTRQKKAEQQLRRAIKRGDVPALEPTKKPHHRKQRVGPTGQALGHVSNSVSVESSRRLQSSFVKLPPRFLEESKSIASTLPLLRPIPNNSTVFVGFDHKDLSDNALTCPRRPKWRFDMSKVEVERNEEALFKKWFIQTDQVIENWQDRKNQSANDPAADTANMPVSPSYYERNLEVWRQLWRVSEISQILLILLDSRCPTLHYPPSLANYLSDRKIILVLTKVDIAGPMCVEAWTKFLHTKYPTVPIVQVKAYLEKEATSVHQGQRQFEPIIPQEFRETLIEAIKKLHGEMLDPPENVKNNTSRLKNWVPPIKREINWDALYTAQGDNVGIAGGGPVAPRPTEPTSNDNAEPEKEASEKPDILTIGLIGQPNVGKSSLLNALFGARRVRASKTPGKTKHFQTLFWTADVRLVDCPGLVMPNFVPMEMQVLSGILPISRISAIASCTYFAAHLLPLERIYKLVHPTIKEPQREDKRTWREGMKSEVDKMEIKSNVCWTAMDILTSYADSKGWVTAKVGRPDVNRAGNAILRALAEGRISWTFWPPGTHIHDNEGLGIWIPKELVYSDEDSEDEDSERDKEGATFRSSDKRTENNIESSDEEGIGENVGIGRFGALALSDTSDDEDPDSEEVE